MDNCKKPSYEISIEEIRKNGGYYDINGLWNSIMITDDNKFLRERVETFIFKIDQNRELQVYLRLNDDNTYRIPGGSVTKGIPDKKQAYLECKEEARIIVKDMEYTGIHYIREFENCNEIGYNEPDKMLNFIKWHGTYNKVYIGFFEAEYHGDIKRIDQDNDMYNNGKFYLIKDILPIINDNHKPIFDRVIEYSKSIQDYKDDYFQITLEEYNDSTNRQKIQAEYETNIRNLYLDNKFLFKIKFLEKQELLNLKSEIKDNQEAIPIANYQFYDSNGFTQLRDFLTSLNNSKNNKIEGYGFVIPDEHSMSGMIYVKPGLVNEQQEIEQNSKNMQTVDNYSRTSRFSPTEIPTNSWVDDFYAEYKKYQQEEDKEEENKKALLDLGWDVDSGMSFKEAMKMADIIENKALSDKVIKIDENFIFNEIEELRYVYSDPDGEDILNENYIIDKKNAELDIDMWKKDSDHNILFITGLSGSGKSTYARQLAKEENATIIELDIFQCYDKFKNAGTRKNDISMKMVSEFLEDNPEMVDIDFSNIKLESFGDSFTKYFKWLLNKLHKSNERYIIEGIHIMLFIPYSDIKGEPIICIGTSMIKSFWRMWKREGLTHKDFIKYGKRYFLLYKEWERQYKNFQDSFNESYIEEASKSSTLFHLSFNNLDNTKLQPKIPSNFLTLNGYENNTEKRVCFSPSIKKCLRAMSQNLTGKELYVHVPISNKLDVYTPTIKEVPDSKITGEVWIKTPVKIKCIGKIKVDKASDNDGIEYRYGNNTAMLYDWDYHWVDKINESYIEEGMFRINKAKLSDENYVKELIRTINNTPEEEYKKRSNVEYYLCIAALISMVSVVGAPLGILMVEISEIIAKVNTKDKEKQHMVDCIDKTIVKLKKLQKVSKDSEKIEATIKKLEKNKKLIKGSGKVAGSSNNNNIYRNGYIKISGNAYFLSLAANFYDDGASVNEVKKCLDEWDKPVKDLKNLYFETYLEEIIGRGFGYNQIMEYIKLHEGNANYIIEDTEKASIKKRIVGKTLTTIIDCDSDCIIYCKEDNCCYKMNLEYEDEFIKLSLPQVLQASMKGHNELKNILKNNKDLLESFNESYIEEGILLNQKDIYYNKEKFDSGEINLCFITGHSMSGYKTIDTETLDKNIEYCNLYDICHIWRYTYGGKLKAGKMTTSFFKGPGKKYFYTDKQKWEDSHLTEETRNRYCDSLIKDFIEYAFKFVERHNIGKYVIEGDQIVCLFKPEEFKNYAIYIRGTSAFTDNLNISNLKKVFSPSIKTERSLKRYRKYFSKKSLVNESSLTAKKRNNLPDKVFGLPEKRKYPMPDKKHVLSAIKLFNFVDDGDEKELAENIKKKMKEYKIDNSHVGEKNRLKKYL